MITVAMVLAALRRANLSTHHLTHDNCGHGIGSITPYKLIYTSLNPCYWWPWYQPRYAMQIYLHITLPMLIVAMVSAALRRANLYKHLNPCCLCPWHW